MRAFVVVVAVALVCSALAVNTNTHSTLRKLARARSASASEAAADADVQVSTAAAIANYAKSELAGIEQWRAAEKTRTKAKTLPPPGQKYWGWAKTGVNEWCASFVSYCLNGAGYRINSPNTGQYGAKGVVGIPAVVNLKKWFTDHPNDWTWMPVTTGGAKPTPQAGDVVIFDFNKSNAVLDHTGIVTGYSGGKLSTIEGNTGSGKTPATRVLAAKSYADFNKIAGFGRVKK